MQRRGIGGHLLRHEAQLDVGADAIGQQAVVYLVDVAEVVAGVVDDSAGLSRRLGKVDGAAVGIVEADLIIEDAVEADRLEVRRLLHGAQVIAIALTQRQDGAAGAEGLLPEVREWRSRGLRIDVDVLRLSRCLGVAHGA